jgi:beta-glucosidase
VAYPFGYGLSYTTYSYGNLQVEEASLSKEGTLKASVDLSNQGEVAGEEIVQLYIGFKNSSVDRPVKLLRAFDKVLLRAGESKTVELEVSIKDLAWYDPEIKEWKIEEMEYELFVGSSSNMEDLIEASFIVN